MRLAWRTLRLVFVAALSAGASSCVQSYDGSWVEFALSSGTQLPADVGNVGNGQPPGNTHYEYWVATGPHAFKVAEFQVAKQFDSKFPCFIETGRAQYPGLHSSRFYDKVLEDALADGPVPDQHEIDLLADADKRRKNQKDVEGVLKAVVGYDPGVTPQVLDELNKQIAQAPAPITDMSADANARRLAICEAFFKAHPDYYVGGDKVFSLPLAGHWYGMVEGTDPRSNAPVGGAGFTVPFTFKEFDFLWMNWQFNDAHYKADGKLDTSAGVKNDPRITMRVTQMIGSATVTQGPYGPSATGYHYMSGKPEIRTRRTINVDLQNQEFGAILGKMAIFPGINEDDATF